MESRRALLWSGKYFLITAAFAIVGAVLFGVGVGYGGLQAYQLYQSNGATAALNGTLVYWVVAAVGILIWRFGRALGLYMTLTSAVEEQLSDTYDTEHVKSDIVSILDERLADMQQDLQSVNRELREVKRNENFDFQGDD